MIEDKIRECLQYANKAGYQISVYKDPYYWWGSSQPGYKRKLMGPVAAILFKHNTPVLDDCTQDGPVSDLDEDLHLEVEARETANINYENAARAIGTSKEWLKDFMNGFDPFRNKFPHNRKGSGDPIAFQLGMKFNTEFVNERVRSAY